jgi:phospholipase C
MRRKSSNFIHFLFLAMSFRSVIVIALLLLVSASVAADSFPIKKVVALMLENRAFDHMLVSCC